MSKNLDQLFAERYLKYHEFKIAGARSEFRKLKQVLKTAQFLPDLYLPDTCYINLYYFEIDIVIPWDVKLEKRIQDKFVQAGWVISSHKSFLPDYAKTTTVFWHEKCVRVELLMFAFLDAIPGQECELVQLGSRTETKEVPIYEVICKEGAEEMGL